MKEAELQRTVEDALTLYGWEWFHDRSLAYANIRANRPGFPDLCAVHPGHGLVLFLELKSEKGKLTEAQKRWGAALAKNPSVIYAVVRPSTLDALLLKLKLWSAGVGVKQG